ncbi:amidohydrolase family protein [Phyllobacterium zundukense]|uniref:Amidohydrolase-related domain-containing protein n=1 Tax=Phyllobacterium zundukense TaxID=1867719 RepID=A0A2N9VYD5_9HYPH|nr:amidohydrolase family protein [Phyllobacterium zundukense]ATU95091.1 hypothetical protein BLM14_25390 [Phyllobacterium zundukense]PIO44503.1 hypothetical protein B5P45_11520 [Phyllobacterium zundukense]
MADDLSTFIAQSPLCSTHEHTEIDSFYQEARHDILTHLFDNYVIHDLYSAGATSQSIEALLDVSNPDIGSRFSAVETAWQHIKMGGFAEAVRLAAFELFEIENITSESLKKASAGTNLVGGPGERLRLLRDVANLDHVQVDPGRRPLPLEMIGQTFFHYDLNVFDLCNGTPELSELTEITGEEVDSLRTLALSIEKLLEGSHKYVVALKSQHAYKRTLEWTERSDDEAASALTSWLRLGANISEADRLCLGDWCTSYVAKLAAKYNLPFKLHTGLYGGNNFMDLKYIPAGSLSRLVSRHPDTRFLLMHIAYPYSDELIAMAKHYNNVAVDMCWAWSINPIHATDFVQRFIHGAPVNKLFIFGGDALTPAATVGYALQARRWLTRCLRREVTEGFLSEKSGVDLAGFLMMDNPKDYFDVAAKSAALLAAGSDTTLREAGSNPFRNRTRSIRNSGRS